MISIGYCSSPLHTRPRCMERKTQPVKWTLRRSRSSPHRLSVDCNSFRCSVSLWMTESNYFMNSVSLLYKILKSYLENNMAEPIPGCFGMGSERGNVWLNALFSCTACICSLRKPRLVVTLLGLIVLPLFSPFPPCSDEIFCHLLNETMHNDLLLMSNFAFFWKKNFFFLEKHLQDSENFGHNCV